MSKPIVGSKVSLTWPGGLDLSGQVTNIKESSKEKFGSNVLYTLACSDGVTRKTRLTHLKWSLLKTDEPQSTEIDDRPPKKKARWSDATNRTIYIQQGYAHQTVRPLLSHLVV